MLRRIIRRITVHRITGEVIIRNRHLTAARMAVDIPVRMAVDIPVRMAGTINKINICLFSC
jgi:hypothetical protein